MAERTEGLESLQRFSHDDDLSGRVTVALSREEAATIRDVLSRYSPGREMDLDLSDREKQLEAINKLLAALTKRPQT